MLAVHWDIEGWFRSFELIRGQGNWPGCPAYHQGQALSTGQKEIATGQATAQSDPPELKPRTQTEVATCQAATSIPQNSNRSRNMLDCDFYPQNPNRSRNLPGCDLNPPELKQKLQHAGLRPQSPEPKQKSQHAGLRLLSPRTQTDVATCLIVTSIPQNPNCPWKIRSHPAMASLGEFRQERKPPSANPNSWHIMYEQPQSGTAMWTINITEGQADENEGGKEKQSSKVGVVNIETDGYCFFCEESESGEVRERTTVIFGSRVQSGGRGQMGMHRMVGRGQMGVHRRRWQRPNGLAQKGVAEAKWACTEGGGRGQMGLHRRGWQRPNGLAQKGVAEAKWACTGWGGRGQMGLHRMEWQRPNGLAQDGVAEAKWACTEWGGRGQMGLHRMGRQRLNGLAQDGVAEAKWACTEWGGRGQMGLHRMERQRPNGACTEWHRNHSARY
ncbi:hypothetical protein B0H14DRAFT_3146993 [Mycena olivaceomarginata]|nr:hypothetical protein B0H14DRAFT_3146993 [Mycena olivaceomarginata]